MDGENPAASLSSTIGTREPGRRARRFRQSLTTFSFWGAIALPAVYVPLLVAGIETTGGLAAFLLLFGLHVLALVGGHRYGRTAGQRRPRPAGDGRP